MLFVSWGWHSVWFFKHPLDYKFRNNYEKARIKMHWLSQKKMLFNETHLYLLFAERIVFSCEHKII